MVGKEIKWRGWEEGNIVEARTTVLKSNSQHYKENKKVLFKDDRSSSEKQNTSQRSEVNDKTIDELIKRNKS